MLDAVLHDSPQLRMIMRHLKHLDGSDRDDGSD